MTIHIDRLFYVFPTLDIHYITELPTLAETTLKKALKLANEGSEIHRMDYSVMKYDELLEAVQLNRIDIIVKSLYEGHDVEISHTMLEPEDIPF